MYDITDKNSFDNVESWFREIEKYASENVNKIIIGNKADLNETRAVTTEEGQELAKTLEVQFMETSAKDSINVAESFSIMAQEIKNKIAANAKVLNVKRTERIVPGHSISPKKSNCCQ